MVASTALACIGILCKQASSALANVVMEKVRILDLFNGTRSVTKAAALDGGFECCSLDIFDKFSTPDVLADIHDWNYREFSRHRFDIIAASVPCQMYSCARTRAVTPRDIPAANKKVECVLEIVEYFNPTMFWIENPVIIFSNIKT